MVNASLSSVFQELTSSHIAVEFNTFSDSQIIEAKRILAEPSNSETLAFAQFLLNDYPFKNLLLKDESKRKLFAFAMAQCWLSTRTNTQISGTFSFLNCFVSPLSSIIASDYQLNIDEASIIENLTHKKSGDLISPKPSKAPIDYEKRFSNWSFLSKLNNANICKVKTLVLVANAMSTQTHLLEFSRISGDKCVESSIDLLSKDGFLELDVPKANLLAIFPLEKIKKFAIESGLENIPSRKDNVVALIKEKRDPKAVAKFARFLLDDPQYGYGYAKERFILPTIPNAKIFQDYVRSELSRLALYLEYIGCVEYKNHTVISPIPKRNQPGNRPGDYVEKFSPKNNNKKAFSPKEFIDGVTSADLQKIQKYWDGNCDALLTKVVSENPSSFPVGQLVSEIMSYWDKSGALGKYKKETRSSSFEKHWHWLLNSYASYLLGKEKIYKLPSTERVCNGCGSRFKEWSIPLYSALKVNKKIEFCDSCYSYIFNHHFMANTTKAFKISEKNMLNYLFELSNTLGVIPTRKYMESVELPAEPTEKQIKTGKILLKMPAYEIYIEKFGNWLKCLSLAGVLDDGHRKTSRGVQCLANDGHLCLSLGEKTIDDWLSNHNIPHEKESFYPFDEKLNPNKLSRTDWKIGNIFIEYAGLMDDSEYASKMKRKKQLADKNDLHLIIIEPADLFSLDEKLKTVITEKVS
ncbi:MAG: hypothetical protein MHPDNHAH_03083 [Anaerolineales bacterium]|nr:hypothetical protein [Anaerolineales bacterium]